MSQDYMETKCKKYHITSVQWTKSFQTQNEIKYLKLQIQNPKTTCHITNAKYKDNISLNKYRMQRQYLTLQILNAKPISHLTNTKCKGNISSDIMSPYKFTKC